MYLVAKTFYFTSDKPHYPYQLPERWKWCKLEDIAELIEDCPHSTAKDEGQGFALIRTPNIGIGHLIFDNVHRVSKEVYDIRNARAVPQINDIIYAREAPAGNAAIINDKEKVCLGQRTVLIRPMQKWIDSMWLTYTINSPYARKTLISKATGSTVTHVNMENIRSLALPLPPLQEQSRIVESIEHWLSLVDCIEESNNNLQEAIRQTKSKILDLAIHGKLVPQDPTDEPASELLKRINPKAGTTSDNGHYQKLPEGWCETTLKHVLTIKSGNSINVRNCTQGLYPIYGGNGITGHTDDYNIKESTIVIGRVGYYCGSVYLVRGKAWVSDNAFITTIHKDIFYKKYLYYLLQFLNLRKFSNSTAQPVISGKTIYPIHVLIPPIREQKRIVAKIEEIFAHLNAIEASL